MMYPALVVFFASLASPAANAFTSSPTLHRLNRYQSSTSLFSDNSDDNEKPNVRFEKFNVIDGDEEQLGDITFPLSFKEANFLKRYTEADSVTIRQDFKSLSYQSQPTISDIEEYKNEFKPLYPGDDGFWKEFKEVHDVQKKRRKQLKFDRPIPRNPNKMIYNWPELWMERSKSKIYYWKDRSDRNLNLDDFAQSVKGEFSNYHQQDAITKAISNMKEGRPEFLDLGQYSDDGIIPKRDFIDFQVRAAVINAWSLEVVARTNFYLKWYHGVPRPEEVAWKIAKGHNETINSLKKAAEENPDLENIIRAIKRKDFEKAADFTAYTEGSPNHPSFPAMHSAGSTCSTWFPALYNINSDDYAQLLRMDYGVAFARTVAGVHYPQDNLAGLNIGQRIVRKKLPEFLAENYGYDAELVRKRLDDLAFDWKEDYDNANDKINKIDAKEFLENANEKLENRNKERIRNNPN